MVYIGAMPDERTALLQEHGRRRSSTVGDENVLARTLSPSSHWLAPDPAAGEVGEADSLVKSSPSNSSPYLIDVTPLRFWIMYIPILTVYFVGTFDSTLMASAHPVITSYFHSSNSASWLSTVFMLTSTTFQPYFARLSDTFGRRPLYLVSLVLFAATTAWCALAQNISSFIAARALCGIGAGGIVSMGTIMTNDLVRIERRGVYQSFINIFYGLGSTCGAAFGGFLCDTLGWRWAFGIQVPPILLIFVFGIFTVPAGLGPNLATNSERKWYTHIREFDIAGSILLSLTTACLILGLNLGGNVLPWQHPFIIACLCLCVLSAAALVAVEKRASRPVMPIGLLTSTPKANLLFSNFFSQIGVLTIIFNAPLYFQAVKLDSPSVSGFRLAAPSLLLTVCAGSTGFWANATGRLKEPQLVGAISQLIGGVCLSSMWDGIPTWLATIFVIPPSVGQGFMFPMTTLSLLAVSTKADQAVVTSSIGVWRNMGTVMGVAFSSLILQNTLVVYLDQFVTGPDKEKIIERVRSEVRAITELPAMQQMEVMHAYQEALRWVFISAIIFFVAVNILLWPMKLPRLGRDRVAADEDEQE